MPAAPAHAPGPATATGLASFWLLYMAGLGLVFPFQTLYFTENAALGGIQLGLVLGVRPLMGLLFQPLWGVFADRSGWRSGVLTLLAFGAAAGYLLVPAADGFAPLLGAVALASLFSAAVIPMATSVSMAALGERAAERFGRVRVWGTVGFLGLVVGFPPLLHRLQHVRGLEALPGGPSEPGLGSIFVVAAGFTAAAGLVALRLPREGALRLRAAPGDLRRLLRHGPYRRLLAFTFTAYFFLPAPILLLPVLVRAHGGSLDTLGRLWIPMLLLEIPLILLSGAGLRRLGARGLLAIGVVADGVRWTASALAGDLWVVYAVALLHGVVVAGLIIGIQLYVEQVVPPQLRSTGQGLMAMVGISAAGALSSLNGGWLLERFGDTAPFLVGGVGALLLGASIPAWLPRPERPVEERAAAAS